eukprot:gene15665-17245_t
MFASRRLFVLQIVLLGLLQFVATQTSLESACYDQSGKAKTCMTYPKNVAVNRKVTATNTCGTPVNEIYCQVGANKDKCATCDASNPALSHPAKNMIDPYNPFNTTWWQSQSWWQTNIQGTTQLSKPLKVNITINFSKLYLITGSIRVTFYTVRPKRMFISRSIDNGMTWSVYQYYAKDCLAAYNLSADPVIDTNNKYDATCTQKFSSQIPYAGGSVVFDPRIVRYTVSEYLHVDVQRYLAATDVRLTLEYPGTDGREHINSTDILSQYYYAISNVVVNGRCDCHGHAEYCDVRNGTGEECDCKHFTTGKDCHVCLPLYNNRAWMAGNATDANECQKCECYEHASACVYNHQIGSGVCSNCQHNTRGRNCDICVDKYYRNASKPLNDVNVCIPCDCFMLGVTDNGTCLQSASPPQQLGQCSCKAGIFGRKCDQCVSGKWGFVQPPVGTCFDCACNMNGTIGSNITCNQYTGQCDCKANIESRTCSQCKDTFHSFPTNASTDCQPCGCDVAGGYPICNKRTGVCTCRRGITDNQCTTVMNGYYFPNFTHVKYELEMMQAAGNHGYYWLFKGYRSIFLGVGQVKLSEGQSISYNFQVPVTHRYTIVVRYSLYPLSWYNTVYLYNAESVNWSGDQQISSYTTSADNNNNNTMNWNISVTVQDSASGILRTMMLSIGTLAVGEGHAWTDSVFMHLLRSNTYRVTFAYLNTNARYGSTWPLVLDSVMLMPDLTQFAYVTSQPAAIKMEIEQCYTNSKRLQLMPSMLPSCRQHTFAISVLMYNGTLPCDCYGPGSVNSSNCQQYGGQCTCKPGYGGRRCEHCLPGFHGDTRVACVACGCSVAGSATPVCNQTTGDCFCKLNVQGSKCNSCKTGMLALTSSNPDGCQSCYGFGHLTSCKPAENFVATLIISNFTVGLNGWSLMNMDGSSATSKLLVTTAGLQYIDNTGTIRYFQAPPLFLGNQLNSYGQLLSIEIRIASQIETSITQTWQVRLVGGGMTAIFNLHPLPNRNRTLYTIRIHEKFMANATKLSEFDFKSLIGQLTGIHIIATYSSSTTNITFKSISMESASLNATVSLQSVGHVENATCLIGYEGLSCEQCSKGFTREVANGGPLFRCVPCNCSKRSTDCDQQTGVCKNCRTGTTGDHCEKCMPNLMQPNCTSCMPGFWKISSSGCQPCNCYLPGTLNGNTITCDLVTGQCLCNSTMHVEGRQCNQCKQNAYNVSLGELRCKQCPPCYSVIEQDYIILHYQMTLLRNEVNLLLQDQRLASIPPLYQSLATVSVIVGNLTARAQTSLAIATQLDSLWTSMQSNITAMQTSLSTTTTTLYNKAIASTTQILTLYNQSYALVVSISQKVVASYTLLTTTTTSSIAKQQAAIRQLNVLLNESTAQLAVVRTKLGEANRLKTTANTSIAQSIQISTLAATNSQSYQSSVSSMSSSMSAVRASVTGVQSLANELHQFALEMRMNASSASVYANKLNGDVTTALTMNSQNAPTFPTIDGRTTAIFWSQVISSVNTQTTTISSQVTSLNTLITTANSLNNGVGQQLTVLRQSNAVATSEVSTIERRHSAVTTRVTTASTQATSASTSATNTRNEAIAMLNTVQNFQSVSQRASIDAANASKKVGDVIALTSSAINKTSTADAQLLAVKTKVSQIVNISAQINLLTMVEKQAIETVHSSAKSLQSQSQSAMSTITGLKVQDYITATISPLLSRCVNQTTEANSLLQKALSAHSKAQLSLATSQNITNASSELLKTTATIPSLNMSQIPAITDGISRLSVAYGALNIQNDLTAFKIHIEAMRLKIVNYRLKIDHLKSRVASFKASYASLSTLTCTVPSAIP